MISTTVKKTTPRTSSSATVPGMGDENQEEMMQTLAAAMQVVEQQKEIIGDQKDHITTLINQHNAVTRTALDVGSSLRKTARSPSFTLEIGGENPIALRCSYEMLENEDIRAIVKDGVAIVGTIRAREDKRTAHVAAIGKLMEDPEVLKKLLVTLGEILPEPDPASKSDPAPEPADSGYVR